MPGPKITTGKPDPTLLPMDVLTKYLIPAYEEGLVHYYRDSWREGIPVSQTIAAALRHIEDFYWQRVDWDASALKAGVVKHHLAGAIFSLLTALHTMEYHPQLDDRGYVTGRRGQDR